MLGQASWVKLSPSGPAVLLLTLCGSMSSQDICSSPGDLQAPALQMNSTSAQPGTTVVLQCILPVVSHVRRIIICKDGMEAYSHKAQQRQLSYSVVLNITSRSAGRYTCGYQALNEKKYMSSAHSALHILDVHGAGAGVTTQDICSSPGNVVSSPATPPPPAPYALIPHALPKTMALAVAAVSLVLLAAGSWFAIRKGSSTLTAHRWKPQTTAKSHVSTTSSLGGSHAPISGGIPPLHFPLGYTKSLPVHQGQVSLQHLMSCFFVACRAWLLPAQGTWQHPSSPRDKAHLHGRSFHTSSGLRQHFPCFSLCFCPFFSFSSVSFLLQELHKAYHSNERCGSVSLHWWGKYFRSCSETTGSSQREDVVVGRQATNTYLPDVNVARVAV
eukprot:XP_027303432.1 uncharacterized protein LOC113840886 isoform X1 [Anas platyrhynchos]